MRILFFITLLFTNYASAQQCDCIWRGSFADIASKTDLIIAGEVISRSGNSADIKIEKIFQGKHFQDSARIWGAMTLRDGTQLCRANVDEFAPGSRWIMALEKISAVPANGFNPETPNQSFGRKDDYALSNCGAYWLAADGETARGNIINGERWTYTNTKLSAITFSELEDFLRGKLSADDLAARLKRGTDFQKLMNTSRRFIQSKEVLPEPPER